MKLWSYTLCIAASLTLASHLYAQTPAVPAHATVAESVEWLRGSVLRMVAWAAHFTADNRDQSALPELERLAEAWHTLPPPTYDAHGEYALIPLEQQERTDAMFAVLDALIRLHGTVSAEAIKSLAPNFTAQALTLFAAMPEPQRTQYARSVYATRRGLGSIYNPQEVAQDRMVHLAAALLAQQPPPGFTASLLNEMTVLLYITVTDQRQEPDGGIGTATCSDSFAKKPLPGWPQAWTYVVEELWSPQLLDGTTVLVPGYPAITTRRALSDSSCSTLGWFSSAVRLQLAEWEAALPAGKLRAGTRRSDTLQFFGAAAYKAALASAILRNEEPYRQLAALLASKGMLSEQEAHTAQPILRVEVLDKRSRQTEPLPEPRSNNAKVVFEKGFMQEAAPWTFPF